MHRYEVVVRLIVEARSFERVREAVAPAVLYLPVEGLIGVQVERVGRLPDPVAKAEPAADVTEA